MEATYLEHFLDCMDHVPIELSRYVTQLRELDSNIQRLMQEMKIHNDIFKDETADAGKRRNAFMHVQRGLKKSQEYWDEKLQITRVILDIIGTNQRQLSQDEENIEPNLTDTRHKRDKPKAKDAKSTKQSDKVFSKQSDKVFSKQPDKVFSKQPDNVFSKQSAKVFSKQSDQVFLKQSDQVFPKQSDQVFSKQSGQVFSKQSDKVFSKQSDQVVSKQSVKVIPVIPKIFSTPGRTVGLFLPGVPIATPSRSGVKARGTSPMPGSSSSSPSAADMILESQLHTFKRQRLQRSQDAKQEEKKEEEQSKKKKKRKAKKRNFEKTLVGAPIEPDEPTYCVCEQVSYGDMIGCDNDLCAIEWFHFGCVSLKTKPKGKWYCPTCRGDRSNVKRANLK